MNLFQKSWGQSHKPTIVLLHGWGMNADIWNDWAQNLADDYHIVAVDLPGLGRSDLVEPFNLDVIADTLVQQLPNRSVLVGWSLGGLVAVAMANRHPESVSGVITIASNPCFVANEDWHYGMDAKTFSAFEQSLQTHPDKTLQRFAGLMVKGDPQVREQLRLLKALFAEQELPAGLSETLALLHSDARGVFSRLFVPCEFWFAEHDQLVSSEVMTSEPVVEKSWLIAEAGHIPFLSQQQVCTERLKRFMDALIEPPKEVQHG